MTIHTQNIDTPLLYMYSDDILWQPKEVDMPILVAEIAPQGVGFVLTIKDRPETGYGPSPAQALREFTRHYPNLFVPGTVLSLSILPLSR